MPTSAIADSGVAVRICVSFCALKPIRGITSGLNSIIWITEATKAEAENWFLRYFPVSFTHGSHHLN
ncbi:hypothetical protein F0562_020575 [Nyssa sinensis]|uniref:Uncharacterized protein n=1 Tax=Nyssa sinensis TaxID=561372 RepID=A0A5J5BTJ5_9ASTE|nr:hypothetical protein F0562_020575 [Nyssa sinensis]